MEARVCARCLTQHTLMLATAQQELGTLLAAMGVLHHIKLDLR